MASCLHVQCFLREEHMCDCSDRCAKAPRHAMNGAPLQRLMLSMRKLHCRGRGLGKCLGLVRGSHPVGRRC